MSGKEFDQEREKRSLSSKGFGTLIFLLLAIYFRFIGGTWLIHINSFYHSILNISLIFLVFLIWFIWKVHSNKQISLTGLELFLAAFVLVIVLSTIFADNVNMSSEIAGGVLALILSIYIFLDIKGSLGLWESLLDAILITGAINIIMILGRIFWWFDLYRVHFLDIFLDPVRLIKIIPRLPDLQNFNSNVTAAYLLLLVPIIIYKAATTKRTILRYIVWLYGFVTLIVLVLTRSRGGYIGLLAALLAFAILYRKEIFLLYKSYPVLTISILSGMGISAIIGAFFVFKSRGNLFSASFLGRVEGWRIALEIIQENPLFGTGFGGYAIRFMDLRDPALYSLLNFHAHNEILNLVTNLGLAGLAIFSLIIWKYIKTIWRNGKHNNDIHRIYLISLAGFIGMGLVDSFFDSSNIVLIVIILLVGLLPDESIKIMPARAPIMGFVLLSLICIGSIDIYANWKLLPYEEGRHRILEGDLSGAMVFIDEAIRRDPDNLFYDYSKAQISGEIDCLQGSASNSSIRLYEEVLPQYGNWGLINANLASLYANTGDYMQARSFMQDGIDGNPGKAVYYCLLGDYQHLEGLIDESVSSYSSCLSENANWIDTPYWHSDRIKTDLIEVIAADMTSRISSDRNSLQTEYARILFIEGRFNEITPVVMERIYQGSEEPDLRILYARFLADNGQFIKAEDELLEIIEKDPRNSEAWSVLAGLYLELGKFENSLGAINISTALEPTPENLILSGLINSKIGNIEEAILKISWALNWRKQPSSMAAWTARRFPIQLENLSCVPDLLTFRSFYDVAWEGIKELSVYDCEEAERIYSHIEDEIFAGFGERYGKFPNLCGK